MMPLSDRVRIARRFQRSVRIDRDMGAISSLNGFVCPQSSADVLLSMAHHISKVGHGAFTWTGPYGSGKSSLAVAFGALLSGEKELATPAARAIGGRTARAVLRALPRGESGWQVIPIVGRREDPVRVIGETVAARCPYARRPKGGWTEGKLIAKIEALSRRSEDSGGGLVLLIDEMGKFLEGAAQNGEDVFVFQQLAEAASRSGGRFLVVGILHQAFEGYANRLSREVRDEWSKIQGRFVDLPVNMDGEEQLRLISRAIEAKSHGKQMESIASDVSSVIRGQRPSASPGLEEVLLGCWPLHPVAACLLGPISRRRFGQNQRSIFGFLSSAEPQGLQDFLRNASDGELYAPARLWEYLRYNLEPSILASPDGHRWSLAVEAVQRCEALGGDHTHLAVLKTIALVDMFKERSGLLANRDLLLASSNGLTRRAFGNVLRQLQNWSLVIHRKFAGDYAIFAGSDFDIESAVKAAFFDLENPDFASLGQLAVLQPILAKRHYHRTGTLCWFDIDLASVGELHDVASRYRPGRGAIGQFILSIPTAGETEEVCRQTAREASKLGEDWDIVAGISPRSWTISDLARELRALEHVRANSHELAGDPVARREVGARIGDVQEKLESSLQKAFDDADWYCRGEPEGRLIHADLNSLASKRASERFDKSPRIFNELLNRIRPSGSAVGARKALLRRMVANEGEPRLGIDGFPAEGGLYASLLEATGLHVAAGNGMKFRAPPDNEENASNLQPIWRAATGHLEKNSNRSVPLSEVFDIWRRAPYGVRDGLMPVLAVAYMLSRRENLAFYREGIFQGRLSHLDMDYLARDAGDIQLRWMNLDNLSRRLLSGMAEIVRSLDQSNALKDLAPIDVARGLIGIYTALPPWTRKTMHLSRNALQIRQLFKRARDPNKFLFDDLPESLTREADPGSEAGVRRIVEAVHEGLEELRGAYPAMLHRLRDTMLAELQVPNVLSRPLAELRERAENVRGVTGDLRQDAFIGRIIEFDGSDGHVEGLAGLAANKPVRDWADPDIDRAALELTDFAQKFIRAEAFARVKGRTDKRHAMAVVVGINGRPAPVAGEFDVTERDQDKISRLVASIEAVLDGDDAGERDIVLAALAMISSRYLDPAKKKKKRKRPVHKRLSA